MPSVLIIEDDPALLRGVSDNFASRGYQVDTAADGETGLARAQQLRPDLIILDVMLPRINGYEICRALREDGHSMPVIFLTAKDEESDILLGLGLGGDDYVTKPFGIRELLARADAVLRRSGSGDSEEEGDGGEISFGSYVLDRRSHKLRDEEGRPVELSPKEYDLLAFLVENAGRALSRDRIMDEVWGYGARVSSRSIDRFVTTLRKKIEQEPADPVHIETIREFGYRFRK